MCTPRDNTINEECIQMSKSCRLCSFGNTVQNPNVINTQVTFVFQTEANGQIWLTLPWRHFDGRMSDEVEQHE